MALASLDGKIAEYLKLVDEGMNTLELDIKDENGEIGFLPSSVPLARQVGAAKPYYKPREVGAARPQEGRLPDRARRHLRGSDALATGRPELAIKNRGRLGLAQPGRSRLDEPVRQARLGLQRLDRRGRGTRGLRRDPVRLRPLPDRRGRRVDRLPRQDQDAAGLGDRRVRPLRGEAAEASRRAHLDRRLRARRDPRPRDRPGSAPAREVRRCRLPDGLPVALRPRRVRARRAERRARRDRRMVALGLPARAEDGKGRADPVAAGLLVRPHVRPRRCEGADRSRPPDGRARLPALESARHLHARRPRAPE